MDSATVTTRFHHHKWPYSFSYFIASECNLRCSHCYVSGGYPIPRADTRLSAHREYFERLRSIGYEHVIFVGGEPTLNPALTQDIRFVLEMGMKPVVFTNGVAVQDDLIRFAKDHPPTSFVVSLYGLDDAHDSFTRVPGSFRASMATVDRICATPIHLQINTAVTRRNAESVWSLVQALAARPIDWVSLLYFSPFGSGSTIAADRFRLPDWNIYLDRYRSLNRFALDIYAELMTMPRSRHRALTAPEKKKTTCTAVHGQRICFDTAGNLFPCPMFAGRLQSHFHLQTHDLTQATPPLEARRKVLQSIRHDFRRWTKSNAVAARHVDSMKARVFCPAHHGLTESEDKAFLRDWVALCPFFQEHLAGPELTPSRTQEVLGV